MTRSSSSRRHRPGRRPGREHPRLGSWLAGMHTRLTALGGSFDAAVLDDVFAARARIPFDVHGGTNR